MVTMVTTKRTPARRGPARAPRSDETGEERAQGRGSKTRQTSGSGSGEQARGWTFLTNHAHILLCLVHDDSLTARELGQRVGITERSVQTILSDLVDGGYLEKTKIGRRNHYTVNESGRLRHPVEAEHTISELIEALA